MPSRTRRSTRRGRIAKREVLWATIVLDNVAIPAAPGVDLSLVLPSDWVRNNNATSFQKGAVLERVRGWIDLAHGGLYATDAAGIGTETVYAVVWKSDEEEDVSANDWGAAPTYNDEDLLWVGGAVFPGSENAPAAGTFLQQPQVKHLEFDIKSRRKLDSDTVISFTLQSGSGAPASNASGVLRALITLP